MRKRSAPAVENVIFRSSKSVIADLKSVRLEVIARTRSPLLLVRLPKRVAVVPVSWNTIEGKVVVAVFADR